MKTIKYILNNYPTIIKYIFLTVVIVVCILLIIEIIKHPNIVFEL